MILFQNVIVLSIDPETAATALMLNVQPRKFCNNFWMLQPNVVGLNQVFRKIVPLSLWPTVNGRRRFLFVRIAAFQNGISTRGPSRTTTLPKNELITA